MTNKKEPNLRFLGHKKGWYNSKFGGIVDRVSNSNNNSALPRIEFEDIISGQGTLRPGYEDKINTKKGIEFMPNDILFGKLRPYLKNWLYADFKGIAIGDFWVFRPKNTDGKFIYTIVQSDKFQKVANLSSGTKMPRSDWNTVSNTTFKIPEEIEEQQKIGEFFKSLDDRIALQQRQIELLKESKQGFLQKMFPKDGERVPEVRFDEFSGEWKKRLLNECLTTSKVKNRDERFGKEDVLSVSGDFGIVNQIEFQGRSFAGVSVALYGVVETGDVVYTKSPLKSNPYGIIKTNKGQAGIVSTLYAVYKPNDNVDSKFVERYFENDQRLNRYLKPIVNKGAKNDMKVSDDNALIGTVVFPVEVEEQQKIGEFFKKLDDAIATHEKELELLQETKKGFLQKMFV